MRLDNIKQQNFKGGPAAKAVDFISKHPVAIAGLAGSSVITQKIVMSGSEATIGPGMDILVGKTITKATKEKDGRTNQSSKVQGIRTHAQAVGGTITGVAIRALAIGASFYAMMKAGEKSASKLAEVINPKKLTKEKDLYEYQKNASAWGKSVGGVLATLIMIYTNFAIDVPLVNWINKKISSKVLNKNSDINAKGAK